MEVKIDIYSAAEFEAFGVFCQTAAVARKAEEAERKAFHDANIASGRYDCKDVGAGSGSARALINGTTNHVAAESAVDVDATPAASEPVKPASRSRAKPAAKPAPAKAPEPAETQAQDAADEQAESAASAVSELTHDSVRDALGKYVNTYGMAAAQADGAKVFTLIFGSEVAKVSSIPADQASLQKAIDGLNEAIEKNPFGREAVAK